MRVALAQLAPVLGDVRANLGRLARVVGAVRADLVVFPELYLSGYRLGDRFHAVAVREGEEPLRALARLAHERSTALVVGAPIASPDRSGEVENVALAFGPDGREARQGKRYLPTFGPFEEGSTFTPTDRSRPVEVGGHRLGLEICYDVFFPEVTRELALAGAELLVNISAAPVTSRRLFEKLLPARAVENGLPVVYVNRVGVEDGFVFGGGSGAWDARGEPVPTDPAALDGLGPDETLTVAEIDLGASRRWRPFRPVLRDVAARPPAETRPRP